MALRIIFCGTPVFAIPSLERLINEPDFQVEAVVTQPDRPSGRGGEVRVSPVKAVALQNGLRIFQPQKMRSPEVLELFKTSRPDAVVIIAFGQIIPANLLAIPRLGWINVHGSLLPKYRGAAPIQWAIANGETHTGLTTMQIDAGLDTGPMLLKYETEIGRDETAPELAARLAEAGAPLTIETLRGLASSELKSEPQDHSEATFAPILKKEDGRIDWSKSAREIYNRVRGFEPWPGAFTAFRGKTAQVWGRPAASFQPENLEPGTLLLAGSEFLAACGAGSALRLDFVQVEGRKRVTATEFANGARLAPGERFGG